MNDEPKKGRPNGYQLYSGDSGGQPIVYMHKRRKRVWLLAVLAAVILCAAVLSVIVFKEKTVEKEIKGNAGIVALYDCLKYQQDCQEDLAGELPKEMGIKLLTQPFEIESDLKLSSESFADMGVPFNNITMGLDVKYDMKDFGIKASALGMDLLGGYLIGDDVVLNLGGKAGSLKLNSTGLDKPLLLKDRFYAVLPFIPKDDKLYMDLIEKLSFSVPDSTVSTDKMDIYSPENDKKVKMNVISVNVDAAALKQITQSFSDSVKGDKELSRQLKDSIDGFTKFAGLESKDLNDLMTKLTELTDTDKLKDMKAVLSVYQREGKYTGFALNYTNGDKISSYTYMCEFNGKEEFISAEFDADGYKSSTYYRYLWQGNKVKISGRLTTGMSENSGVSTELIDGTLEAAKESGTEYKLTGDMMISGNVYNEYSSLNKKDIALDIAIDADIKTGDGLGTLKESRDWDDIYKKEWGDLKDMLKNMFPNYSGSFPFSGQSKNA